ncbi:hypothetical protein HK104_007890, partial [Borealophlyctis nickersoniae]
MTQPSADATYRTTTADGYRNSTVPDVNLGFRSPQQQPRIARNLSATSLTSLRNETQQQQRQGQEVGRNHSSASLASMRSDPPRQNPDLTRNHSAVSLPSLRSDAQPIPRHGHDYASPPGSPGSPYSNSQPSWGPASPPASPRKHDRGSSNLSSEIPVPGAT